jgi:hypothetical protein
VNHPLPDVAAEMQNQIADTVAFFIRPPPDFVFAQFGETGAQPGQIFLPEMAPRFGDKKFG